MPNLSRRPGRPQFARQVRRQPKQLGIAEAVLAGLTRQKKCLPSHLFYDRRGSELFEEITRLPEYYPTRAETEILAANAHEIAAGSPDHSVLVELGSGSSIKTELLLQALRNLAAYMPIDVSGSALAEATVRLSERFPGLAIRPVLGDFSGMIRLPQDIAGHPRTGFFPGSTVGNLTPLAAVGLLAKLRASLLRGGRMIVGVDLKKDVDVLTRAYNDAAGVTAAFNLNILARINREIEPAFDLDAFRHEAIYDDTAGRIEMHLVSLRPQIVRLLGRSFTIASGETIHTENSYKYTTGEFRRLCRSAGWTPERVWTDHNGLFSVHDLRAI